MPLAEELSPTSPTSATAGPSKRNSRLPPPIPGAAPALPPAQTRPPPPPPPTAAPSRQTTIDSRVTSPTKAAIRDDDEDEEEVTEYEGDYDTDIASSVPHKDALKSHGRESSFEDSTPVRSPVAEAPPSFPPPVPSGGAPRGGPPPIPSQLPPAADKRRSVDQPRLAPPPPPPSKETSSTSQYGDDEYDPYSYAAPKHTPKTPKIEEEAYFPENSLAQSPSHERRGPPPAPPSGRAPQPRQSLDINKAVNPAKRSLDVNRPSMESGFIANDLDLAKQSGWWKQANQVPPVLQGRRDVYFESEESTSTNRGAKTIITRTVYVLFQDYSQTILTVRFDPYDPSDVELEQRQEPPPRTLRQDQLEQSYDRFGRQISDIVTSKKDTVVADGSPQGLIHDLLRPYKDALAPIGTRAYGALVYSNMANASTQQFDEIRPGDILSIRNAKFQGKHGAMHAKYSTEVGKPDHVAVVAEWDGTKKKVRAWEQGRESKKVKIESFKLDDLRSGEVKIWRVMPRSWVGWNTQP
jgi:myosin tail region-interacting protein MTI1